MPVQPNLFPEPPRTPVGVVEAPAITPDANSSHAPLWLQRLSLVILVLFCVYLGVVITVLPWWTSVWDHNLFFTSHPWLWAILRLGPVRGVISGVGLLDIWIGISEAINYRDDK